MNRKTIRSSAREIIYKVYARCLAELEAGQILSDINDVYKRTAEMTGNMLFYQINQMEYLCLNMHYTV